MGIKRIISDMAYGARWARLVALLAGIVSCAVAAIAVWLPWNALVIITLFFCAVSVLGVINYLRVTRPGQPR